MLRVCVGRRDRTQARRRTGADRSGQGLLAAGEDSHDGQDQGSGSSRSRERSEAGHSSGSGFVKDGEGSGRNTGRAEVNVRRDKGSVAPLFENRKERGIRLCSEN